MKPEQLKQLYNLLLSSSNKSFAIVNIKMPDYIYVLTSSGYIIADTTSGEWIFSGSFAELKESIDEIEKENELLIQNEPNWEQHSEIRIGSLYEQLFYIYKYCNNLNFDDYDFVLRDI